MDNRSYSGKPPATIDAQSQILPTEIPESKAPAPQILADCVYDESDTDALISYLLSKKPSEDARNRALVASIEEDKPLHLDILLDSGINLLHKERDMNLFQLATQHESLCCLNLLLCLNQNDPQLEHPSQGSSLLEFALHKRSLSAVPIILQHSTLDSLNKFQEATKNHRINPDDKYLQRAYEMIEECRSSLLDRATSLTM